MNEETATVQVDETTSEPVPLRDLHAYETRVIEEKNALDDKIVSLNLFIDNTTFRTLALVDQDRLIRQRLYMVCYSNVLLERVQGFAHMGALRALSFPAVWVIKD